MNRQQVKRVTVTGALSALALSGCSYIPGTDANKISKAQKSVAELMKDPASAQFSDGRLSPDKYICGYVNAKNSYGAYQGREAFIVQPEGRVDLENAASTDNPGIDAMNRCEFKIVHAACMAGQNVLSVKIKNNGPNSSCMKASQEAIDEWHKNKVRDIQLGID